MNSFDSSHLVEKLQTFGMNGREARLYVALLQKPEASASELHRISGVPRTKTYEALERMVREGFCRERLEGNRRFYRAIRPKEVFGILQHKWANEYERRVHDASNVTKELESYYSERDEESKSLDFIEVIRSKEQINHCYISLVNESMKEILTFTRSPYACLDPQVLREQEIAEVGALRRNVVSRTIYMMEEDQIHWLISTMETLSAEGDRTRFITDLPMKMFVFDRQKVLLALPSIPGQTGSDFTMVVIEDEGFCHSCVELFNMYWERAETHHDWMEKMKAYA